MKRFVVLALIVLLPVCASAGEYSGSATGAELDYVSGVTSAIQTQLDAKQATVTEGSLTDSVIVSEDIKDGEVAAADLEDGACLSEIADDDGTGSGLDADTLDGHDTAYFAVEGGAITASSVTITGADADPSSAGQVVYDNSVSGMSGGALRWYDNDSVRLMVDLETDPSDDDYVVAYDADADGFYMKADSTGSGSLGSNLTSSTNDITSDNNQISLVANSEDLDFDFTSNTVTITTDTGVTSFVFTGIGVTAPTFTGDLTGDVTGNADTFTATANNDTDETVYPVFVDGATGTQGAETDTGLAYNPSTGVLSVAGIDVAATASGGQLTYWLEDSDNGSNYVGWGSPASNDNDLILLGPTADPTGGQVLSFAAPSSVTGSDGTARDSSQSSWITPVTADSTTTFTNKTFSYAGTGNDLTVPLNGLLDGAITDPADADDMIYIKVQNAITITDIHCLAEGGGTITVTLQECTSAGASCSDIEGAITADSDGAEDDGTLTDGAIAAGAWIKVLFGAPSGTVNNVAWAVYGTQTW